MPELTWDSIKDAKILFIGGLGHGGTRAVMEYVKRCYDAFPGNVMNHTNDSFELLPLSYQIMQKATRGSGPSWNELAEMFKSVLVKMLTKGGIDPNHRCCVFKAPEFLLGGFHLFSDLLPNALFICVTREAVAYSCGRRKEHESTMENEASGQAVFPAIWAHTYGDSKLSWNTPRHNKMALVWIFNQAWIEAVKTKLGDRLQIIDIEDMRDKFGDFAEVMNRFTGWTNNGYDFPQLCRSRLKNKDNCDDGEKADVVALLERAGKVNATINNFYTLHIEE